MDLQTLADKTLVERSNLNLGEIFTHLTDISTGAWNDVLNIEGCGNYQFLSALMKTLKPRVVVELGGAMGVGTLMMLANADKECQIYSITLEEGGLEFSFIKKKYPNLHLIVGNDLDMENWPKDMQWEKVDFLYIDSKHTKEQLKQELDLYLPILKKGTIIAIDDIYLNDGMKKVWNMIYYHKIDLTKECHWSGWGLVSL